MDDFTYKFDAIRGTQGGRVFYQSSVPFRVLASMLKLDDDCDVTKRSQRLLSKPRARNVAKYIQENHKDGFYVIPPLIGIIEGDFEFEEIQLDSFLNVGKVRVPIDSKIVLFDGQHRATGIKEALQKMPEICRENVSIMFFQELSLPERKQAFHDINFTQKTPAAAICIAYNERSEFDKMVIDVFSNSAISHLIEYEKNSVSGKSDKVYSLKSLRDFTKYFVGTETVNEKTKEELTALVSKLFDYFNIVSWINFDEMMASSSMTKLESLDYVAAQSFREKSIAGHAVTLKSVALFCRFAVNNGLLDSIEKLSDKAEFSRYSERWEGRCVRDGKMVSNQQAVRLTYYELKRVCEVDLTKDEIEDELNLLSKVGA